MQNKSDAQLLREYAMHGSEAAFGEIVVRHTDLVYSSALRRLASPDLARDMTQRVFTDLARKARALAGGLEPNASLAGWLYRGTRFAALNQIRDDRRRAAQERQAMTQLLINSESAADWDRIRPVLDEAVDGLSDEDRDALLLRYFKNHDFHTVGLALGVSDDAAQKRVSRAVQRLREFFAKRGITVGAGGLAVAISANAVQAAPVELAAAGASSAALAGTAAHASTAIAAGKITAMTTLQKVAITAAIATVFGAGIYEARRALRLGEQAEVSLSHQNPMVAQVWAWQRERDEVLNRLALLADEESTLKGNSAELLKLRGEATRLGKVSRELARFEAAGGSVSQLEKDLAFAHKYPGPRWKAFLEQDALDNLARLKEIGGLTPDQEPEVRELLLKQAELKDQAMQEEYEGAQTLEAKERFSQSCSNLNAQIDALLSPDQQAALQTSRQRGAEAMARMNADAEIVMIQHRFGISREQESQIFQILYDFALKQRTDDSVGSADKAGALAKVLTPAQMVQYRKVMQEKSVRVVMTPGQKS
jgi:RNA polymerase sigma factor (sigma-70 family)